MGSLSNLYISQSYQSLAHLGTNNALVSGTMTQLQDGIGQSLNISFDGTNISSSGNIFAANLTGSGGSINTGSLMVTGSVAVNVLTFTKGDGSQFSLTVASSGSVTPGTISGSAQITALGFVSSSVTASSLITASFNNGTRNLTFTKGDNTTFNVNIPDVSGSTFDTGSFATTGSNTFTGNQTILGNLNITPVAISENPPIGTQRYIIPFISGSTVSKDAGDSLYWIPSSNTLTISSSTGTSTIQPNSINIVSGSRSALLSTTQIVSEVETGRRIAISGDPSKIGPPSLAASTQPGIILQSGSNFYIGIEFQSSQSFTDGRVTFPRNVAMLQNLEITGSLTASLQQGFTYVGDANGRTTLVATSSFGGGSTPAGTISGSAQITALGFVSSSVTASSIITASFSGNTLTFTKGDASTFSVSVTGASIDTGSFATTASFNAYTQSNDQKVNSLIAATGSYINSSQTSSMSVATASVAMAVSTSISTQNLQHFVTFVDNSTGTQAIYVDGGIKYIPNQDLLLVNNITSSGYISASSLNLSGTLTASLQQGYAWVGNGSNVSSLVATSSFGTSINTGSFATTGSNTFTGDQTLIDDAGNFFTISDVSGSMMLVAKGFTSASAHISASSAGIGNFIFKNSSATADTIISGSANIFVNPTAPTAGFKRYIGTSNYYTHGSSVPQISGSMAWSPTMNGNLISNTTSNAWTWRGPVSSSASNLSTNILMGSVINLGSSAALNHEKALAGINFGSNALFGAQLTSVANVNILSSSVNINSNLSFGGTITLNSFSSSISYNSNINNGSLTINNRFTPSGSNAAILSPKTNTNTVYGTGHIVNIDGTNVAATQGKSFSFNILAGTFLTASVPDGDASSVNATGMIGNGLVVTGSTVSATFAGADVANSGQGSLFSGRFNALDGTKSKTGETVFAVGTGTSYTNRKTGFLIDSGSNSFFEGTLNVSGSSNFNGNVSVTGSLLVNGSSVSINTGSFATTGSNSFLGNQTITGSLRVSGSTTLQGNTIFIDRNGTNNNNIYLGDNSLSNNTTGFSNVAIGQGALSNNTTGINNFGLGVNALQSNTAANNNFALGVDSGRFSSGSSNVFIGGQAGQYVTGSNNTIIGSFTGTAGTPLNNNIILANGTGTVKAQYSGSAWSFQDDIRFNKGSNKTSDIVTVNASATISNSLVTANSIILVTCQDRQNQADEYPPVVGNKTTGTFDIFTNVATNMEVAYLIINPTV